MSLNAALPGLWLPRREPDLIPIHGVYRFRLARQHRRLLGATSLPAPYTETIQDRFRWG